MPEAGAAGGSAQVPASWFEALPEDLRGNEKIAGFKDAPDALAKEYLGLAGKLESSVEIPKADSSAEVKAEFATKIRAALGVPESAEGYQFQLPEGVPADDPLLVAFRGEAHRLGYSPEQAQGAIAIVGKVAAEMQEQARVEGKAALEKQWGPQFKENLDLAHRGIRGLAADAGVPEAEFQRLVDETGLGNYPYLVRMLAVAGKNYSEDTFKGGGSGSAAAGDSETLKKMYPTMFK